MFGQNKTKKIILAALLIGVIAAPLALVPIHNTNAQGPQNPGLMNQTLGNMGVKPTSDGDVCKLMSPSTWAFCILDALNYLVNAITLNIFAWLLGVVASVMDFAIKLSLDTSYLINNNAINSGWKLIRDLVNMSFIFIMIYIAISTILQLSSYNIRSMLAKLIIAAVLINFSLFITKVVMDAGNIVAQNFYNSFAIAVPGQTQPQPSIGAVFKGYLKIQDKYDPLSGEKITLGSIDKIFDTSMRFLTICVAIYVFFRVILLFVARILAFVFIMIFSPIGFIGGIFPGASGAAAKWRKLLIDQTLVAPVFLILIYLAAQMIASGMFNATNLQFNDPNVAAKLNAGFYFNYVIVIGFFLMALKTTKKLSGEMGAMVENFGKKAFALAAGATLAIATGGAAAIGRGTIGAFAKGAATGTGFKGRVAAGFKNMASPFTKGVSTIKSGVSTIKSKGLFGAATGAVSAGATKVAEATRKAAAEGSYDIRRAKLPLVGTVGEASKKYLGVDMGKAMSPAERAREKEKLEKERKEDVSRKQFDKDKNDLQVAVNANDNRTIFAILQGGTDSRGVTHSGMVDKKVTDLSEEILKKVGNQMKSSQFEAVMKGDFEQDVKSTISENRFAKVKQAVDSGTPADLLTAVQDLKMKPADIAKLKADWLKNDKFIEIMNTQMLPKILEELQPSDFDAIKSKIVARAGATGATPSDKAMEKWLKTNSLI